jgi:integrase
MEMIKNNGGYSVRNNIIYVYGTIDNKRVRKSTKLEATKQNIKYIERNYRDVLLKLNDEKNDKLKLSYNLGKFAKEVIDLTAHKRDKQSQNDYLYKIDNHIVPYFKHYELNDIKPFDIEKWQNILLEKGYSTTTVRRCRSILSMVLKKAVGNDMITKNPCDFADNITVVHQKQEPYSINEMNEIINGATGWLKVFVILGFTTGMRPGELMGLQWDDIDFEKKVIFLKRAIVKGVIKEDTVTKNHNRIIIVIDYVLKLLKELKESSKSDWVFVSRLNKPYYEIKGIRLRHFEPLLEKVNVENKGVKAMRHTYISILRNDGVDINLVLDMVGHSSKEINDKHYYTAVINDKKIEAVNNVFSGFDCVNQGTLRAQ